MYKPPVMTPELAYRRTKTFCLDAIGWTEDELQALAKSGVEAASSILLGIERVAQDRANLYRKETQNGYVSN